MKLIKINATINLNSGVTVAGPSFLAAREIYFDNQTPKDASVTTQVSVGVYTTQAKAKKGNTPILDIADFKPLFNVEIPILDYTTKDAETVAINAVLSELIPVYTAPNLSIITV